MAIVLVVEDGTGKSDANTYTSVIDADTFNEQRGRSAWLSLEDDEKAAALIKATEFIDGTFNWIGRKTTQEQALQWPRNDVDDYGETILVTDRDGFEITGVPAGVKKAVAEAAFLSLSEDLFQVDDPQGKVIRKKTDVLETEYQPETVVTVKKPSVFDSVNSLLKGLYSFSSGGMVVGKAVRG